MDGRAVLLLQSLASATPSFTFISVFPWASILGNFRNIGYLEARTITTMDTPACVPDQLPFLCWLLF